MTFNWQNFVNTVSINSAECGSVYYKACDISNKIFESLSLFVDHLDFLKISVKQEYDEYVIFMFSYKFKVVYIECNNDEYCFLAIEKMHNPVTQIGKLDNPTKNIIKLFKWLFD